jgi:hypothetical protein
VIAVTAQAVCTEELLHRSRGHTVVVVLINAVECDNSVDR